MIQYSICFLLSVCLCLLVDKWNLKFGVSNKNQASLSVHKLLEPWNVSSWGQSCHFILFYFIFEALMLRKIEGKRRRGQQKTRWLDGHHWFNGHEFEQTPGDSEGQRSLACCSHGIAKSWTWLSDWIITTNLYLVDGICFF